VNSEPSRPQSQNSSFQKQNNKMEDLNELYYFVQVVEHKGFAPAGRALHVPKSKLSRRIAHLEERLGVRLIIRSTRHFSVTEVGRNYYHHCKAMLVEAEAAQEAIEMTRAEPCGVVRMTCPIGLMDSNVNTMLSKFMIQNPRVELHLESTNRRVDIVNEAVDIAIRVRRLPLEDSDWAMRLLGDRQQCILASPKLANEARKLDLPAALNRFPSLGLGLPHQEYEWVLHGPDQARVAVKHKPRFITGDMTALRNAAVAGVGIVQLPRMIVVDELQSKALIEVIPDWAPQPETIHLVFVSRRGLLPSVRTLIDFLVDEFAAVDEE